jgi:hypothetical protein
MNTFYEIQTLLPPFFDVTNRTKQSTTEQHGEKREGERQPKKK